MTDSLPNLYRTLGVSSCATDSEIRKAYRQMARDNHPDRVGNSKAAHEKMAGINAAWETLSDPEKRRKYDIKRDTKGTAGLGGQSGFGFGFDFGTSGERHRAEGKSREQWRQGRTKTPDSDARDKVWGGQPSSTESCSEDSGSDSRSNFWSSQSRSAGGTSGASGFGLGPSTDKYTSHASPFSSPRDEGSGGDKSGPGYAFMMTSEGPRWVYMESPPAWYSDGGESSYAFRHSYQATPGRDSTKKRTRDTFDYASDTHPAKDLVRLLNLVDEIDRTIDAFHGCYMGIATRVDDFVVNQPGMMVGDAIWRCIDVAVYKMQRITGKLKEWAAIGDGPLLSSRPLQSASKIFLDSILREANKELIVAKDLRRVAREAFPMMLAIEEAVNVWNRPRALQLCYDLEETCRGWL